MHVHNYKKCKDVHVRTCTCIRNDPHYNYTVCACTEPYLSHIALKAGKLTVLLLLLLLLLSPPATTHAARNRAAFQYRGRPITCGEEGGGGGEGREGRRGGGRRRIF